MSDEKEVVGQFEAIAKHLNEVNVTRERVREVVEEMEGTSRQMHSELLTIHGSSADAEKEIVAKAWCHVEGLRVSYAKLASIMKDRRGEFYRFNDLWRNQNSTVTFLLAFCHWLGTGSLLPHKHIEELLHLNNTSFRIDLEDYLIGICSLSNELPRYVINRVTAGDYDCPKRAAAFLNELFAAFRKLNLRNDTLRKRYDGIKYDVKKVEEVLYDVELRRLKRT